MSRQGTSMKLSVRGRPSAFDLSPSNEMLVVASPGCLTFFHLNGLGSPRLVIHYEQPQQIRQLKYQKHNNHSSSQQLISALRGGAISIWDPSKYLRPLIGLIQDPNRAWMTDMQWSSGDQNLIAAGCDSGDLLIWDIRTPRGPAQQHFIGGVCNNIEWCPSDSNLLSSNCANKKVVLWDTRMSGGAQASHLGVIEPESDVHSHVWVASDPSIALGLNNGTMEWWDISTSSDQISGTPLFGTCKSKTETNVLSSSILLASTVGKGVVVSRKDPDGVTSITLQGYPRDGKEGSLQNIFTENQTYNYGPPKCLHTIKKDTLLGMKWGTPGRLIPPSYPGLELLMLTESATLTALKLSGEVVSKYCGGLKIRSTQEQNTSVAPNYLLKSLKESFTVQCPSLSKRNKSCGGKSDFPSFTNARYDDQHLHFSTVEDSFWKILQEEVLRLEESLQKGWFEGLVINRIDQYARQVMLDVDISSKYTSLNIESDNKKTKVVTLFILFPPTFPRLGLPSFTVKVPTSISNLKATENSGVDKEEQVDNTSNLVKELTAVAEMTLGDMDITTGRKYFSNNRNGHVDLTGENKGSSGFLVEIAGCFRNRAIQYWGQGGFTPSSSRDSLQVQPGLHIRQDGENKRTIVDNSENNVDIAVDIENDISNYDSSTNSPMAMDVICELAYRVPNPASSGGRFSSRGLFVCFGGAALAPKKSHKLKIDTSLTGNEGSQRVSQEQQNICQSLSTPGHAFDYSSRSNTLLNGNQIDIAKRKEEIIKVDLLSSKIDESTPKSYADLKVKERNNIQFFVHDMLMAVEQREGVANKGGKIKLRSSRDDDDDDDDDDSTSASDDMSSSDGGRDQDSVESGDLLGQDFREECRLLKKEASIFNTSLSHSEKQLETNFQVKGNTLKVHSRLANTGFHNDQSRIRNTTTAIIHEMLDTFGRNLDLEYLKELLCNHSRASITTAIKILLQPEGTHLAQKIFDNLWPPFQKQVIIYTFGEDREQMLAHHYSTGPLDESFFRQCYVGLSAMNETNAAQVIENKSQNGRFSSKDDEQTMSPDVAKVRAESCRFNANQAVRFGANRTVQQVWHLLSVSLDILSLPAKRGDLINWTDSSLGQSLLRRLIFQLRDTGDAQTLATAVCILGGSQQVIKLLGLGNMSSLRRKDEEIVKILTNKEDEVRGLEGYLESVLSSYADTLERFCAVMKATEVRKHQQNLTGLAERRFYEKDLNKLSPHSHSQDNLEKNQCVSGARHQEMSSESSEETIRQKFKSSNNVSSSKVCLDVYCSRCGELACYRGCDTNDSSIESDDSHSKSQEISRQNLSEYNFDDSIANSDHNVTSVLWCNSCRHFAVSCVICQISVKDVGFFCSSCGHGGHLEHVKQWFEQCPEPKECPTGCGCRCSFGSYSQHHSPSSNHSNEEEVGDDGDWRGGSFNNIENEDDFDSTYEDDEDEDDDDSDNYSSSDDIDDSSIDENREPKL